VHLKSHGRVENGIDSRRGAEDDKRACESEELIGIKEDNGEREVNRGAPRSPLW
jgi:hypothetical protein